MANRKACRCGCDTTDAGVKRSHAQKGRVFTAEHRERIRAAAQARVVTPEVVERLRALADQKRGKPHSAEHRAKIGEANRVRVLAPRPERRCTYRDCDGRYVAGGFCSLHYKRMKTTGQLEPRLRSREPATAKYRRLEYGISHIDFSIMRDNQDGFCAICRINPATHLDHDHATGRIRGILCQDCNFALGHARDDTAILERAVRYLREAADDSQDIPSGVVGS